MTKDSIRHLRNFAEKLLFLFGGEIEKLSHEHGKDSISAKRNLTDSLNKLTVLLTQIAKLKDQESDQETYGDVTEEDRAILERFAENLRRK